MATITKENDTKQDDDLTHVEEELKVTKISIWRDSEIRATAGFILMALLCLGITGALSIANRPVSIMEYGKVGQQFYPEFNDPTLATELEVYAFDKDDVKPLEFQVKKLQSGRWVIPSHHDYPADSEDRLAKTAASMIGIERGAMVTRWPADHANYGVVDPRQDSLNVEEVEGVGRRVIVRGDMVLADYIIGNKVDDSQNDYYVRHPEEDEVYIARLNIDLSTKFTDWIKTDLLDVDNWSFREVVANSYSFDELKGQITNREITKLSRKTSSDDWKIDDLQDESKVVDKDVVREMIDAVSDLKVVGVRPKQRGLTPELKLDRKVLANQKDVTRLQSDLLARGFLLTPGENGDQENLKLLAREGELTAATDDGLVYHLHFGRVFTGSSEELETGLTPDNNATERKGEKLTSAEPSGSDKKTEDEAQDSDDSSVPTNDGERSKSSNSSKPGRYVFVRVGFDEQYLGQPPLKPVEPEMPTPMAVKDKPNDSSNGENTSTEDVNSADEGDAKESKDGNGKDKDKEDDATKRQREYEEAQKKYDNDLKEYERQIEQRKKRIEDGKEKAETLNRRFSDWYYVIPGESFDKLRFSRADLVKEREQVQKAKASKDVEKGEPETGSANQTEADKFLAENKSKETVTTTASGLQYEVLKKGNGEVPTQTSRVEVKYKGTLLDGTVFDESAEAAEFAVDDVIQGWQEALQLMKPGAKWKLYVPPSLGYGESGHGKKIGPNSLLIFEVELVSVKN